MKKHQIIFENLKRFLKEKIDSELKEEDNGDYISIDKSEFWSSCHDSEFIVGLGIIHSHYSEEYENIDKAIEDITNLLTKEIKYTIYKKGKLIFKEKTEIILSENNLIEFGSASAMLYLKSRL